MRLAQGTLKLFIMLCSALLCSALLCCAGLPFPGKADTYWQFYQVSCVAEMRYFSLRSFGVEGTPLDWIMRSEGKAAPLDGTGADFDKNKKKAFAALARHGVYDSYSLEKKPISCVLPATDHESRRGIEITVKGFNPKQTTCGVGGGNVEIDIGGIKREEIKPGVSCHQNGVTSTVVEVVMDADITINRCDVLENADPADPDGSGVRCHRGFVAR